MGRVMKIIHTQDITTSWVGLSGTDGANALCKMGYNGDGQTVCECGEEQKREHLLVCPSLPEPRNHEDLEKSNPRSRSCA